MSGILDAYLKGEARAFFGSDPANAGDRRRAVARVARPLSPDVAEVLVAQNARYAPSAVREAKIGALRRGAAAVVTGQQVGLFLGPLYTIYKAATAIRVAAALADESGVDVVPVFWLQTEDHDLPEISKCRIARPLGDSLEIALPAANDPRVSVAHCKLPEEILGCLASLREALGGLAGGPGHLATLERHYRAGAGWAEAFAGVLAELFAGEGLVILDPRDAALGASIVSVHARALSRAATIAEALEGRVRELEAAGFDVPVHLRPGAPLSFFHPDGARGPRCRLEPAEGGFAEVGGSRTHTLASLLATLETDPLAFSTSALLRPILQDRLLPTAAYVGGPAEVAYFAQLGPLYDDYGLPMPLIVPRARFRVVDGPALDLLSRRGLVPDDLSLPEDRVLARCRGGASAEVPRVDLRRTLLEPFETALGEISPRLRGAGEGLDPAIEKTRGTVRMAVSKLTAKYEKALLYGDPETVADVRRLTRLLCPDGVPQERVYGLPSFAASYGERAFVEMVLAAVVPYDASSRDLP